MDTSGEKNLPSFEQIQIEKEQQSSEKKVGQLTFEQIVQKKERFSPYPGIANIDLLARPKKEVSAVTLEQPAPQSETEKQEQQLNTAKERLSQLGITNLYAKAEAFILSLNQHVHIDDEIGFEQDILKQCLLIAFRTPDNLQLIQQTTNVIEQAYKEKYKNILKKFLIAEGVCDTSGKILFTPRLIKRESSNFLQASHKFDQVKAKDALDNIVAISDLFDKYDEVRKKLRSIIEKDAEQYYQIQAIPSEKMKTENVHFYIDPQTQRFILDQVSKNRNHEIVMSVYLSTQDRKNYIVRGVNKMQTGESGRVESEGSEEYEPGEVEIHTHPENLNRKYHHATSDGDLIGALDSPEWVDPLTNVEFPHQRVFGVLTVEKNQRRTLQTTLQFYLLDLNIVKNKFDKGKNLGETYGTVKFGEPIVFPPVKV